MRVRAAPPHHHGWLVSRAHIQPAADFKAIEAVDEYGRIVGMIGFENWTESSVQCHMAVDSPIAWRVLLSAAFSYPFEQAKRDVLIGVIPENNLRSINMTRRLGFKEAHRIKGGWARNVDLVIFEMRKSECRYLRKAA